MSTLTAAKPLTLNQHFINGQWVASGGKAIDVINPATEQVAAHLTLGTVADVDAAVAAARAAFDTGVPDVAARIAMLERIIVAYDARAEDLAQAITVEMGAPLWVARKFHVPGGVNHFKIALEALRSYNFEPTLRPAQLKWHAIGVVGMITPWNWPLNQIACKVAPALAVGCTMVLKPSENAALSARIFAEIIAAADLPKGVFNMVFGKGTALGARMAAHPDVDLISITGSTRAGVAVAIDAAPTVKRVHQELGGKSPVVVLPSADVAKAATITARTLFLNSGQSCNGPTRLLVPMDQMQTAADAAAAAAAKTSVGDPMTDGIGMGPVANKRQYDSVRGYIETGIKDGARLVCGGLDKPVDGPGYFIAPTVFADVCPDSTIARKEIFGPVLSITGYRDEAEAMAIAHDSPYGLAAYVWGAPEEAARIARKLRAGQVYINGAVPDAHVPFGGFKQSGNGREWGVHAFAEFMEVSAILGANT
jgi:aldehyde dehydrogenase (NAD+)